MQFFKNVFSTAALVAALFVGGGIVPNHAEQSAVATNVDVGCRTTGMLAKFQEHAEPALTAHDDVLDDMLGMVYERVLAEDKELSGSCVVADAQSFAFGAKIGGGFSEVVYTNGHDGSTLRLVISTPTMDDVGDQVLANANETVVKKTTWAPCLIEFVGARAFKVDTGECQ